MRKCKKLWPKVQFVCRKRSGLQVRKKYILQHIPGLQIAESLATPTPGGHWFGGVAVLVPPGYVLKDSHNLVQGRAIALIADRTSQYYIVSVYLHPDRVRQDLAALCEALLAIRL